MKNKIYIIVVSICLILYSLTIRGSLGNPTPTDIDTTLKVSGRAFETSQERARYALILSLVNDHTFAIDRYAALGTPDIGQAKGHLFSFFPPGTSLLALPLYIIGSKINAAQIMTFSISTIFALMTILLIVKLILRLGLHWSTALFSAMAFGFATNAWGYSVTLYAHLISAFLLLLGLYLTFFLEEKRAGITAVAVWTLYALAVFVDFPNLLIYFPIALMLSWKTFNLSQKENSFQIRMDWRYLAAPLIFVVFMGGYGYYNYVNFGNPATLSNFLPRVKDVTAIKFKTHESGSDVTGALQTRSMLEGFRSFIVSEDRGIIKYSPVILLFIFGIGFLKDNKKKIEVGLFTIAVTCLTLYTMFGDPYGGWAFGSRYLIAAMPELCILAGLGLQRFYKSTFVKAIYTVVFTYSAQVALLSPLTTNVIPPKIEAQGLHLDYTYIINWNMLNQNELNSFFYNHILHGSIPGFIYYCAILLIVLSVGTYTIWYPNKEL